MENKINTLSGNLIKIDKSILFSYPVDEILEKHLTVPEGFLVKQIRYQKPFGNVAMTTIDVVLEDKDKNVYNISKEIEFALTENQRVANSVSPSTFKLKRVIREGYPPEALGVSDFIAKYNDVVITSVEYKRPGVNDKIVKVVLSVRTNGMSTIIFVPLEITFGYSFSEHVFNTIKETDFRVSVKLNGERQLAIQDCRYVGKNNVKVENGELIFIEDRILIKIIISFANKKGSVTFSAIPYIPKSDLFILKLLNKIIVKPRFLETYPPAKIKSSFLDYSDDLHIYSIKYYPPLNNKDHNGRAILTLISEGEYIKHNIDLKFKYSLNEWFFKLKKTINGDNFKYVGKPGEGKLNFPQFDWDPLDWKSDLKDVVVDRIEYGNDRRWQFEKRVSLVIFAFFRGIPLKVKKTMTFEMSYIEHLVSKNIISKEDLSLFTVPQRIYDPIFLDRLHKNPRLANRKFVEMFFVNNSSVGQITTVKLTKYNRTSRKAELLLILKSNILGKVIVQEIAYPINLKETYIEARLDTLTEKDIEINREQLTIYPPNNISPLLFRRSPLYRIFGVEYFIPENTSREVIVIVEVGTGNKTTFIEKKIIYQLSKEEYWKKLEAEANRKFILNFKPEDIYIHINVLGEPVSNILPEDISGIPKEIEVLTDYKPPFVGETDAILFITLQKDGVSKTFKQIIHFEKPRTNMGDKINQAYTQLIQMPTKNGQIDKQKAKKGRIHVK